MRRRWGGWGAAWLAALCLLGAGCGQVIQVGDAPAGPSLMHRIASRFHRDLGAMRQLHPVGAAAPREDGSLHGASTTFTNPLVDVWQKTLANSPGHAISYDSVDSRADVQEILEGHAGFAVSEIPLTPNQLDEGQIKLAEMPIGAGPVCVVYNLPKLELPLKLTPEALAGIYLGEITSWNDQLLRDANPNVAMPDLNIVTVHRAHPAGSTYIFSHYLSAVDAQWAGMVPSSDDIARWPAEGRSGAGDQGVLDAVMHVPGGIGYAECGFARALHVATASIRNASGQFAPPTVEGVAAAFNAAAPALAKDELAPIVNAAAAAAYPIVGVVYLIYPRTGAAAGRALGLAQWVLAGGQSVSGQVGIAPLPPPLLKQELQRVGAAPPPSAVASRARASADKAMAGVTARHN